MTLVYLSAILTITLNLTSQVYLSNYTDGLHLICCHYDKTKFIHFRTITVPSRDIRLQYDNKCVIMDFNTNFLGTILDNTLHWKQHIDTQIITLNTACSAIRTSKHLVPNCLWFIFLISTLLCPMVLFFGATPM
jgi:hypothetical protein